MVEGGALLDTSTVIWAVAEPRRLSAAARKAIQTMALVLSAASYWEVVLKVRKGRLQIADSAAWWSRAVEMIGGDILSIRTSHIAALAGLPELHDDPFDCILIAQAAAEGLAIITSDEQIRRYPIATIW